MDAAPSDRAILLSGPRQIGKTTLFLQVIHELLAKGVKPNNILYVTFEHPLLRVTGIDGVFPECPLRLWHKVLVEPQRKERQSCAPHS
ncbi:MAG: AAA family ATPase [Chlorobium sp.]